MALFDPSRHSVANGELLDGRNVWGSHNLLTSAGAETRNLPEPTQPGQRMEISMIVDGGNVNVVAPGTQTLDGAANQLVFSAVGHWAVLESFRVSLTSIEWRVTSKHAAVTLV
jgi:hypothetical protein